MARGRTFLLCRLTLLLLFSLVPHGFLVVYENLDMMAVFGTSTGAFVFVERDEKEGENSCFLH